MAHRAIGPVDLDHLDAFTGKMPSKTSAVAASAFEPERIYLAELMCPRDNVSISSRSG